MRRMYSQNQLENEIKEVNKNVNTLVDSNGRKRFLEGGINIETTTGFTQKYGRWSLSGSHLMIVLACDVADETVVSGGLLVNLDSLPDWIKAKIVPVFSNVVAFNSFKMYAADWTSQDIHLAIRKPADNQIRMQIENTPTLTANRSFRAEFDLIIDNR